MLFSVPNYDIIRFKKTLINYLIIIDFSTGIYLTNFVYRFTITKKLLNILFSPSQFKSKSVIKFIIIFFIFRKVKGAIIERRMNDIVLFSFSDKLSKF
jgi:hypothetical protein